MLPGFLTVNPQHGLLAFWQPYTSVLCFPSQAALIGKEYCITFGLFLFELLPNLGHTGGNKLIVPSTVDPSGSLKEKLETANKWW